MIGAKRKTIITLSFVAVGMFGFAFALVPFYNLLCDVLGINGKTDGTKSVAAKEVDKSRWVKVEFVATNNAALPWTFYPEIKTIKVHPGKETRIAYFAKNNANQTMTIQAVPSVSPGEAGNYFKKIECFCFTKQTLKAHHSVSMPLIFHVDPSLPKSVKTITLSYTLFDVTKPKGIKQRKKGNVL